ncbi:MAG: hypothetical protein LBK42_10310 [Propionibacteriaceae bacterium]|jgi:hypothetical protein|nr:hypothetical protein [Propionibacteriaceae bacterium]
MVSLAKLSDAHARQSQQLAGRLTTALWRLWSALPDGGWWDDTRTWRIAAESERLVAAGLRTGRRQARSFAVKALISAGVPAKTMPPVSDIYPRHGVTLLEVYRRPAAQYRWAASQGRDGRTAAKNRLESLVRDDLAAAMRRVERDTYSRSDKVIGWRRIIHPELSLGGTCGLCVVAADRIYKVRDLMPLHDRCNCLPAPVTARSDPGLRLNQTDLDRLYDAAGGTDAARLKRVRVTENGVIHEPETETSGGRGGGSGKPPVVPTPSPEPDDKPKRSPWGEEWGKRQAALGLNTGGAILSPDDIRGMERFAALKPDAPLAARVKWIAPGPGAKTSDFYWIERDGREWEMKSPRPESLATRDDRGRARKIARVIAEDARHKDRFIIDIGDIALTGVLRRCLGRYNLNRRKDGVNLIKELVVMSRGKLYDIKLA